MQNNAPQQPLFASANASSAQDDIDLNEIFAEYFINEFDDPLNAYTSSMANFNGAATSVATGMTEGAATSSSASSELPKPAAVATATGVSLPTGGIRTVFHGTQQQAAPSITPAPAAATTQTTMYAPAPTGVVHQVAKKPKLEGVAPIQMPATQLQQPHQQFVHQQQPMHQIAQQATVQKPTGGITLPMGMIPNHPGIQAAAVLQQQQQALAAAAGAAAAGVPHQVVAALPPQQQQLVTTTAAPMSAIATSGGVNVSGMVPLPVGVGIRLGGIGGIAPATAQAAIRPPNMVQSQFNIWGAPNANNNGLDAAGGMTEQAAAERRQRNREHAKRSRVRKKFMLESLQEEVRGLERENQNLRMLVQEHIPEHAMTIIADCCSSSPLFDETSKALVSGENGKQESTQLEKSDFSLMHSLASGQQCFVLSDPKLPDNPIVFASPGFYKLTGYSSQEVLGRNCRFLQGPGTDTKAVEVIRKAVATGSDATVCLLNYKSDGTPFWNQFFMAALRDSDNCIVNYVGVQTEVEPQAGASALEDKVNAVMPLQEKDE